MDLTKRQEIILTTLVKEYIDNAQPLSSNLLKEKCALSVSSATIRNDLQELMELGFIVQPHTSAGRLPTNKAYKYFVEKLYGVGGGQEMDFEELMVKEIKEAQQKIEKELKLAQELTKSLTEISITLSYRNFHKKDNILEILEILGPSKTTYDKNMDLINKLLEELENF